MPTTTIDGTGSNTFFLLGQQSVFGTPVNPLTRFRAVLPDINKTVFTFQESKEPSPNRDRVDTIETSRRPNGGYNFECHTEGHGLMWKAALGSDVDVATISNADAGVRSQVMADYTSGGPLKMFFIPPGFPASGNIGIFFRQDGDISLQVNTMVNIAYSSRTDTEFTLTAPLPDGPVMVEDWVILYEDTPGEWDGVYSHFYQAGASLDTVLTAGTWRGIEAFFHYDGKVNSITETYDKEAPIVGSCEILWGAGFSGGVLSATANPGDTFVEIENVRNNVRDFSIFYPTGGKFWIGNEWGINFTGVDTVLNRLTGVTGITQTHNIPPLAMEKPPVSTNSLTNVLVSGTETGLSAFNAHVYFRTLLPGFDLVEAEVFKLEYKIDNKLFDSKVALGSPNRVALPPGQRIVNGTMTLEFNSPIPWNRVLQGTKGHLEVDAYDDRREIGTNTNIRPRKAVILQTVKFTGNEPTADGPEIVLYDTPFDAFMGQRVSVATVMTVNNQPSPVAGA